MANEKEAAKRHAAVKLAAAKEILICAYLPTEPPATPEQVRELLALLVLIDAAKRPLEAA